VTTIAKIGSIPTINGIREMGIPGVWNVSKVAVFVPTVVIGTTKIIIPTINGVKAVAIRGVSIA
jgi:hypothetical protein